LSPLLAGKGSRILELLDSGYRLLTASALNKSKIPDRPAGWLVVATWLVVAVGVLLRVRQWVFGRAFWLDEVQLVDVVRDTSYGLLVPLKQSHTAPPGWLWAEHAVQLVLGPGERALRLLPLLFGCAALVIVALLARTVLGPLAALAVTVLAACSPTLVYYSNEFKQYSSDVFWTLLLTLGAVLLATRRAPAWRFLAWGAVAAVAAWFSHASMVTAAGSFAALGVLVLVWRGWPRLAALVGAGLLWVGSLCVEYVVSLDRLAGNHTLQVYWNAGYPPQPPTVDGVLHWIGPALRNLLDRPLALTAGARVAFLVVVGTGVLAFRRPVALLVLLLPLGMTLAAAIAGEYPLSDRLVLFWVPIVFLLLAAPLDVLAGLGRRRVRLLLGIPVLVALVGGLAVLAAPNVRLAARQVGEPQRVEEMRDVLRHVAVYRRPGDAVLIDQGGELATRFYAPRVGLTAVDRIRLGLPSSRCRVGAAAAELDRDSPRVWVVFGHRYSFLPADVRDRYRAHLATVGAQVERVSVPGIEADLYDLRRPPDDPRATASQLRMFGAQCMRILPGLDD
jgi:hypothetical protein